MLGGGVFVTQNKTLPGSYINFVNASNTASNIGERGVVAIALSLGKAPGTVIEVSKSSFYEDCEGVLGVELTDASMTPLREIFLHANKVYVYDLGGETELTVTDALNALEMYEFNVICAYTNDSTEIAPYITRIISWREDLGKKCQVVVYNQTGETVDHEAIINVVSTVETGEDGDAHALVAWVAGAEAGCAINKSCTNMIYDGEHTIITDKTQAELENCIKNGQIVFHLVYGEVRLLEDVNALVTTDENKGEDFKSNQTIRVIDQIANDIAKLFNTKYLGNIPNNESGRVSLWADIVAHHRNLESIQAIESFNANLVTVEQGANKKSVVVNDVVTVTNCMAQLYMTVVVQ